MAKCPLLDSEYDENKNLIFKCSSIRPHQLECKIYTEEEKKAMRQAWPPYRKVFSKYEERSSCETWYDHCKLYRSTIKPYLEKANLRENCKCPHYDGQSPSTVKEHAVMVECKLLGSRSFFDADESISCLTDCHSCVHIWSDWWKESGRCKFQEVLQDWVVKKDDDGWMREVRYIKFNCKASGEKNRTLEHDRCDRWKYKCLDYNKARAKEIGFVEANYLPEI